MGEGDDGIEKGKKKTRDKGKRGSLFLIPKLRVKDFKKKISEALLEPQPGNQFNASPVTGAKPFR